MLFKHHLLIYLNCPPPQFNKNKNIYLDLANKIIQKIETRFEENFESRPAFVTLHGLAQRLLDKKVVNDVVKERTIILDSHHRIHFVGIKFNPSLVKESAESISNFHSFAASRNIPFLYIQAPDKEPPNSHDMPIGITRDANTYMDELLQQIEERDVPYIDLRREAIKDNLDWYSLHYRTDHHWKIEAAFWAHSKMIEKMNADYGFNLDPEGIHRDLKNYDRFVISFLGSQGKRVGPFFTGTEDLAYYLPRFETQMSIIKDVWTDTEKTSGNFFDAIYTPSMLRGHAWKGGNRYAIYFGGDFPLVQILNPKGTGKILMIQDSYGLPFSAFMSLSSQEYDIVDLRHYDTGSLRELIMQKRYDMILMLVSDTLLNNKDVRKRLNE